MPTKDVSIRKWQNLDERVVYDGYRKVVRRQYLTQANKAVDFDLIQERDACCILAITLDQQIILARQFRPGPGQILNELPGGGIENGEDPLHAAQRELAEETGYTGELSLITQTPIDAYFTAHRYHFVARNCIKTVEIHNDEHEFTQVITMDLDQFKQHLKAGQLTDIATGYLGLEALGLL